MKTKLLVLVALLLLLPGLSYAGNKERLAREMLQLTDMEKMTIQLKTQVMQMQNQTMSTMLDRQNVDASQRQAALGFQNEMMQMVFDELSWDKMEGDYITILTDVYSEEELKAITRFYRSPAGQSMLKKQPRIMERSLALSQTYMRNLVPKVEKMTRDFVSSLE